MEDITAEYATEAIAPPPALRFKPCVTVACKTDLGRVRENNEDKFEYFLTEDLNELASKGLVFLVCDGMGGHAAGQIASELSAKTFIDVYLNHPSPDPAVAALSSVQAANRFVFDVATAVQGRKGMGTTLSGLILIQDQALVVQVGDSRVYRLRQGELVQMTHDHTWVDEQIRLGNLNPEEAATHPYRHVLTRAIGTEATVQADLFSESAVIGDTYLLCSDGVMNHVSDSEIQSILSQHIPSRAAWLIVQAALNGGGSDNTTVVVVRLDDLETPR